MSAGTIFIELDLDPRRFKSKLAELQASASKASTHLETNWKRLGGTSDEMFSIMRKSSQNTYDAIVKHAGVSLNAKLRAHQIHNAELDKLNRQQYLWQESTYQKLGITSQAMYAQMKTDAYSAYAAIATAAGQGSANEVAAAIARDAKLGAIRRQEVAQARMATTEMERNYAILGIKSAAHYNNMRADAVRAFENIKAANLGKNRVILNAQTALNAKLKVLDDQQAGRQMANVGKIKLGWMEMVKGAIVFRVAMMAIRGLYEATVGAFVKGIKSIEDLRQAQISLASAFATNDPSVPFERMNRIAGGVVEKIQEMDRAFVGTAQELTVLIDAWATYGGAVDLSTQKTQDQFVVFANIVKLMTRGQDFQRQAMQEVRALMEGANVQGAMIVKKLAAMGVNTKVMIPLWREQGVLLENIIRILPGYVEGSKEIEKTLSAQAATLSTMTYKILRGAMAPAYKDIVGFVTNINDYLIEQEGLVTAIQIAWEAVKTVAKVLGAIFEGWVLIFRELNGLVERFGRTLEGLGDKGAAMGDLGLGLVGDPAEWQKRGEENAMAYLFGLGILTRAGTSETMQSLEAERDKMFADLLLKTEPGAGGAGDEKEVGYTAAQKRQIKMLSKLSETYDDFYGTITQRLNEYNDYQVKENKWIQTARIKALDQESKTYDDHYGTLEERTNEYNEYKTGILKTYLAALKDALPDEGNAIIAGAKDYLGVYMELWFTANRTIMSYTAEAAQTISQGLSTAISETIRGVTTLKEAFKSFGETILEMIVNWLVQRVIASVISSTLAAAETAAQVTAGAAVAAAWAPAAAAVSLATFGANSAPAIAGMIAAYGTALSLSKIPGYAEGGRVSATPGGRIIRAGEGGEDEWIIPESKMGKGGGNVTQLIIDGRVLAEWFHDSQRTGIIQLRPA